MILRVNSDDAAPDVGRLQRSMTENGRIGRQSERVPARHRAGARPAVDFSLNEMFLHSTGARAPLRIGILVDGDELPAYVRRVLQDIQRCNFADVVLCIRNGLSKAPGAVASGFFPRLAHRVSHPPQWDTVAYGLYIRYLDSRHQPQPNPHDFADYGDLLQHVEVCTA